MLADQIARAARSAAAPAILGAMPLRVFTACLLSSAIVASPAPAAVAPPSPGGPDTVAPVLSKVAISAKRVKAKTGASVSFTLSEDAQVAGAVLVRRFGYLVDGRCRLDAARRAKGKGRKPRKPCSKLVRIGSFFAASAVAGPNIAKLGLAALKPAGYQLTLTPRDRIGNRGKIAKLNFQIVKP